jgi:hypothetical protein
LKVDFEKLQEVSKIEEESEAGGSYQRSSKCDERPSWDDGRLPVLHQTLQADGVEVEVNGSSQLNPASFNEDLAPGSSVPRHPLGAFLMSNGRWARVLECRGPLTQGSGSGSSRALQASTRVSLSCLLKLFIIAILWFVPPSSEVLLLVRGVVYSSAPGGLPSDQQEHGLITEADDSAKKKGEPVILPVGISHGHQFTAIT